MFWYYFTIAVLIVIMLMEYKSHRNILSATVVYPVMWICSLLGLLVLGDTRWHINTVTFLIIIFGYIFFCIGFNLGILIKKQKVPTQNQVRDIHLSKFGVDIVAAIAVVIGIFFFIALYKYVNLDQIYKSWRLVNQRVESGESLIPYTLIVLRYYVRCAIWYLFLVFFELSPEKDSKKEKKKALLRIIVVALSAIPIVFYDLSRNDVLFVFLPVLFEYFIVDKTSDKKSATIFACSFAGFIALFAWISQFSWGDFAGLKVQADNFFHYLSDSIGALNTLIREGVLKVFTLNGYNGAYTFSAILGIVDRLTGSHYAPEVVLELRQVGDHVWTNVYTVYYWTAMDFGIVYSVCIQLLIGLLYGFIYRNLMSNNQIFIYCYSVMSYSLVMMFFQDQYFSIGQSWIILITFSTFIFAVSNYTDVIISKIFSRKYE